MIIEYKVIFLFSCNSTLIVLNHFYLMFEISQFSLTTSYIQLNQLHILARIVINIKKKIILKVCFLIHFCNFVSIK